MTSGSFWFGLAFGTAFAVAFYATTTSEAFKGSFVTQVPWGWIGNSIRLVCMISLFVVGFYSGAGFYKALENHTKSQADEIQRAYNSN